MSDAHKAFEKAVTKARANVRWGTDPILCAKDVQQAWLRMELAHGAIDPRGASDAFVTAVQTVIRNQNAPDGSRQEARHAS